ncbi:YifB family Mg chelatase-like AAA ATPase [candidate division WOR-3 bacterium]|nr:YifB family Mg chelatase-like AAA ATPase [candidate division WOR-3 bacterium]
MIAKVNSSAVIGVDPYNVEVEVDISKGLPRYSTMVGLPDSAVKESKDRVKTAIKNSGFKFPVQLITVNLAPADIKKEGSNFDLPIALGILSAQDIIPKDSLNDFLVLGELSLSGELRGVRGILPIAIAACKLGFRKMIIPEANKNEAAIVEELEVYPSKSLQETVSFLCGELEIEPHKVDIDEIFKKESQYELDFSDVKGQEGAKRALEVATAGGHNVLMIGPPGAGKTMLARRIPTILPELTLEEALETTKIHSVAGLIPPEKGIVGIRPFRLPHHTVSDAGLIGGGTYPKPGEISIAHNGVLFLDELPEFNKRALEVMRQPIEDGKVTISRVATTLTFPSRFMLVAAMNPCVCGYFGDPYHNCTCTPNQIQRYVSKISGPLLDRIDIHIEVPSIPYEELTSKKSGEESARVRERVNYARARQLERYKDRKSIYCNAQLEQRDLSKYCKIDSQSDELLRLAIEKFGLSARAYSRILKVARTIADLENSADIKSEHISEAIQYRTLDRKYWLR